MPERENEEVNLAIELATGLLEAVLAELLTTPIPGLDDPYRAAGLLTWDIFSNNHEVITSNEKVADIGSWRGSGSTISSILDRISEADLSYDYMDFYMGSDYFDPLDNDLRLPYYVAAFRCLQARGADWVYAFPQIHLFAPTRKVPEVAPENYDPVAAQAAELAAAAKQQEIDELRESFAEDLRQRKEDALYEPPPVIVRAYREVFGQWPEGWVA